MMLLFVYTFAFNMHALFNMEEYSIVFYIDIGIPSLTRPQTHYGQGAHSREIRTKPLDHLIHLKGGWWCFGLVLLPVRAVGMCIYDLRICKVL